MHILKHFTKLFLLLLFCISANHTQAQIAIEWQKCFGGSGTDQVNSFQKTSDEGYIVAGFSNSVDGNITVNIGGGDYWIVKLDKDGNIHWQKNFGGTNVDYARSIRQTFDDGYIIAGDSHSNDGNVSGNHGLSDYWVLKIDSIGLIQWQKSLGGTDYDNVKDITQTSDGGYVIAGYTASVNGDVSGNHGGNDFWIVKLDNSGNIQWQKCFGGTSDEMANAIQQTFDGGYVIAGVSASNNGDVSGNNGGGDFWVIKLDSNGNLQWQKTMGGSGYEEAYFIHQTTDGGFVVAGSSDSNDIDVSGNHGYNDFWVVKLDSIGGLQWQQCFGGTLVDAARSVQQTFDGGYIIAGDSHSNDGDVTGNHGIYDFWIVKIDESGIVQWQKCLGGTSFDVTPLVQQNDNGDYVVAGTVSSNDGDVTGHIGGYDYWVVKLTEHYNRITGKLYADLNSNNVQDLGEPFLINKKITESNTGMFGFSGWNGVYYVSVVDSGNYSVTPESVNHFTATPANHTAYFSGILQSDSLNDFAFQPNSLFNDLCITITPATPFRQGMNATYVIHYENVGTTTISNCSVIFFPHNLISFAGANVTPFAVAPDSVTWNIGTLTPFQSGSIVVTVSVLLGTPIGSIINSGARIEPVAGDANPNCNTNYWEVVTTGAVDPNDILVNRNTLFTTEFPNPPFLDYIIRFQNVGNDTAFTVRIYNPIDTTKLEISSLEFVASSHPVDMMYVFHERYMKFTFNNILLVDSTTNEPMSHGFVRYKIKPKSNLILNDSIRNSATIHFDFEAPVLTNTALTTVEQPTGLPGSYADEYGTMWIWPNPVKENLSVGIRLKSATEVNLEVINIYGQTVLTKKLTGKTGDNQFEISLENLPNGVYFIKADVAGKLSQMKVVKL